MTDHLWFRGNLFGLDWRPASREGLITFYAFLGLVFLGTGIFVYEVKTGADVQAAEPLFVGWIILLIGLLTLISCLTGERPRWRRGG